MSEQSYVPLTLGEGYFADFQPPAPADNGKPWVWNNAQQKFVPVALNYEPAGAVAVHAALTATHGVAGAIVGTSDSQTLSNKTLTTPTIGSFVNSTHDHSNAVNGGTLSGYLLDTGATTGATSQRQVFSNGITVGTIRPAADSTTAVQVQTAGGTAALTIDTTNRITSTVIAKMPVVRAVATGQSGMIRSDSYLEWQSPDGATLYWDIRNDGVPRFFSRAQALSGLDLYADMVFVGGNIRRTEANSPHIGPEPTRFLLRTNAAGNKGLVLQTNVSSPTANILECLDNSSNSLFSVAAGGITTHSPRTALTSTIQNNLIVGHNTSGTAAASFGVGIAAQLESSTTESQDAGRLTWQWSTATHASRASKGQLSAYYTTTERPAITWGADSSVALLSFYDVTTPIARQVLATGAGATVDNVISALQALGLVKQS